MEVDKQNSRRHDDSMVNILDFGAIGDGRADDTRAVQNALDAAGQLPHGGCVFIPPGAYRISSHLIIPPDITLEGSWKKPHSAGIDKGSVLLVFADAGHPERDAFITLEYNSCLKGLSIFYPEQDGETIIPYPWCIATSGASDCSILDVLLVNPYQGVDLGTHPSGRHYIRNLFGQPLYRGIFVDQCYDIGRIENVHFWPFWSLGHTFHEKIEQFVQSNGQAFIFARTDWQYVLNTFCLGYHTGYRFTRSEYGFPNGNFLGIGADAVHIGLMVEACSQHGILVVNGEFVSFVGEEPTDIVVKDTNKGTLQLQNCDFWGPAARIAQIEGSGTVMFNNCNFVFPDRRRSSFPAIEVHGGTVIINSCNFLNLARHVKLNPGVASAVISSNRFSGTMGIENDSRGEIQIGLNVVTKSPAE